MPLWVYIVLIVAGVWAGLSLLAMDDSPLPRYKTVNGVFTETPWYAYAFDYAGAYALMVVAFVGACSVLALVGELWRGNL